MTVKKFAVLLGVVAAPFSITAAGLNTDVSGNNGAVVQINGTKLSIADLEQKDPAILFQARNSFYEAERKAIDQFTDQYLLEQQAKKENLTVAQLLDKHVTSTIAKDPSEETLHVYYEGVDTTEPYEAIRGKIIEAIRTRRIQRAKTAYLQSLRSQANVAVLLAAPRADISLKDTPVRGTSTARVTVVEYADYECPYCQQIQPALDKLQQQYKDQIAFVYKDYPLPMHPNAEKAAEAAHCANMQGKYWEYHDELFAKKQLEVPALKQLARDLKLDGTAFDKCLDSGQTSASIQKSSNEAQVLGLQGTPTFFINGRTFNGALSYEKLREVVDEELGEPGTPQMAQR